MLLGILGFGFVGAALVVSTVVSIGIGIGTVAYQKHMADEAKADAEKQALKQERKAKVMHLKQFNRALASYNTGALLAKRDLVQAKRERAYNYGKTVS